MTIDRERLTQTAIFFVHGHVPRKEDNAELHERFAFAVDQVLADIEAQGYCMVPRVASFDMKMAGAEAITAEHMKAMANYDAACDAWSAMIEASQETDNAG